MTQPPTKPLMERIREEMDAWQDERAIERVTTELLKFAEQVRAMRDEPAWCDSVGFNYALDRILAMLGAEDKEKK